MTELYPGWGCQLGQLLGVQPRPPSWGPAPPPPSFRGASQAAGGGGGHKSRQEENEQQRRKTNTATATSEETSHLHLSGRQGLGTKRPTNFRSRMSLKNHPLGNQNEALKEKTLTSASPELDTEQSLTQLHFNQLSEIKIYHSDPGKSTRPYVQASHLATMYTAPQLEEPHSGHKRCPVGAGPRGELSHSQASAGLPTRQ